MREVRHIDAYKGGKPVQKRAEVIKRAGHKCERCGVADTTRSLTITPKGDDWEAICYHCLDGLSVAQKKKEKSFRRDQEKGQGLLFDQGSMFDVG